MCFDADSHPPIPPLAGAAIDGRLVTLATDAGEPFAAWRAEAPAPSGAGILVLPDVRGLFTYYEELALRFAEAGIDALAIDWFGRTAGVAERDGSFDFMPHVTATSWAGIQADVRAAAAALRADRPLRALFAVGFCFGGRVSFLLSSLPDLRMSGVIGFYGWPVGASRNDTPAPIDEVPRFRAPVLGIFGGADHGIAAEDVGRFEGTLTAAGVPGRVVVYPGAPHSFFDRKHAEFAEASDAAWQEVLDFIREHTPPAG